MRSVVPGVLCLAIQFLIFSGTARAQCSTIGQTPVSAFPVCGAATFTQDVVPICAGTDLVVPSCEGDGAFYANRNPYWYKFTCFVTGPLSFTINPKNQDDDYDWQLYDITGIDPAQVFTNKDIIVTGNWSGSSGPTGANSTGVSYIQCGSDPSVDAPRFAKSPTLIAGHDYVMLISHFTNSQSGYTLEFTAGGSSITKVTDPHMSKATADCDGKTLTLTINSKMLCSSLNSNGDQFTLSPAVTTILSATSATCTGFDMQEITITLAAPLPAGDYKLGVQAGANGKRLVDICDKPLPDGEQVDFNYATPVPIFADSVGTPGCAPQSIRVFFPKKIDCRTIAADGSDFIVSGPVPVTVTGAEGDCKQNETEYIDVSFSAAITTKGLFTLTLKTGVDGSTIIDECGLELPVQSLEFSTVDTVSALFTYTNDLGCRRDTLHFTHNGAHDVNSWSWIFNKSVTSSNQSHTIVWPASSTNNAQLTVSNGICSNTSSQTIILDNEVKALFDIEQVICPEDPMIVNNTSKGEIDSWNWKYDILTTSTLKTPLPYLFPNINREANYTIELVAINNTLRCSDSITKKIRVLNNCFIAVPTAFTPNNDGKNDYLSPNNALKADNLIFRVFNRWGQQLFETKDWTRRWDGKVKGILQSPGVYVWYLSYTDRDTKQKVQQRGTTTLIY